MTELREIGGARHYPKYKDCEEGQLLIRGNFRREIMGKYGIQYEFEAEDGKVIVLNGAGQLKYKMDFISPGQFVEITYVGSEILTSGAMKGRPAHQFKVLARPTDEDYPVDASDGPEFGDAADDEDDLDGFEEL